MEDNVLLFVSRIDMQVLKEEHIAVVFPRLQIPVELAVVILREVDHQIQLDLREPLPKQAPHGVPLSLSYSIR